MIKTITALYDEIGAVKCSIIVLARPLVSVSVNVNVSISVSVSVRVVGRMVLLYWSDRWMDQCGRAKIYSRMVCGHVVFTA